MLSDVRFVHLCTCCSRSSASCLSLTLRLVLRSFVHRFHRSPGSSLCQLCVFVPVWVRLLFSWSAHLSSSMATSASCGGPCSIKNCINLLSLHIGAMLSKLSSLAQFCSLIGLMLLEVWDFLVLLTKCHYKRQVVRQDSWYIFLCACRLDVYGVAAEAVWTLSSQSVARLDDRFIKFQKSSGISSVATTGLFAGL